MKKILHVIPGYGGGISSFVKNLSLANYNDDIVMDVVGFSKYDSEFLKVIHKQGGEAFTIPRIKSGFIKTIYSFSRILKKNKYDVVHCHISGYKGLFFKIISKIFKVKKIVTHAHRSSDEKKGIGYKYNIILSQIFSRSLSERYFACSKIAAEHIFGNNPTKKEEIIYIPNSINTEEFLRPLTKKMYNEYTNELAINDDMLVIGHIGRFNIQKNHEFIISIAEELKKYGVKFKIILVGDGELREKIQLLIEDKNLNDDIMILGRREDVQYLIHMFDVFILPSIFEGLPTVAIEAQAAGVVTFLSDTITEEADMKMGLVKYINIDNTERWVTELIKAKEINIPRFDLRRELLVSNGYTIDGMYSKYINSIKKLIE